MRIILILLLYLGLCSSRRVQTSVVHGQSGKETLQADVAPPMKNAAAEESRNVLKTLVRKSKGLPAIAFCGVLFLLLIHVLRRRCSVRSPVSVPPSDKYDYIIVGGGLAGSVLAARLSEDSSKKVLVIESGTANPNNLFIRISGAILKLFRNPKFDWCWQTIKEAGCLGRQIFLCRGKLLGGSTCLNAQLALRGSPRDYDSWGNGWSPEELGATFDSIEFRADEPMESCGMHIQLPNYQHELSKRFLEACSASGESIHADLIYTKSFNNWNAEGGNSTATGFGRFELSQRNGARWTSANSYLAVAMARSNVTVLAGHTVARVDLASHEGVLSASGVVLKDVTEKTRVARARFFQKELKRVLAKAAPQWHALRTQLTEREATSPSNSNTDLAAARKLISNHEAVLRDATNPEPVSQHHLARVAPAAAEYADTALQEVAWRLLENRSRAPDEVSRVLDSVAQASVWVTLTKFLQGRIQSSPGQMPGRQPDLDEQAGESLRSALLSVANDASRLLTQASTREEGAAVASIEDSIVQLAPGGEVVLAAGSLGSPQILQLSGIGKASVLETAGVPLRLDLPAVGEGLQDHPAVTVAYESRIKDSRLEINPFMPWWNITSPIALCKWAFWGSGVLSTTFCDHGAFLRSREELDLPDVQLRFVPGIGPAPDGVKSYELIGKGIQYQNYGFTLQVINCRPISAGNVRIVSPDPSVAPEISCNYLSRSEDMHALSSGIAVARRLAISSALGEVSLKEVYPGPEVKTDEDLDAYIRSTLHSANGISGGCCIGTVVDEKLKVKGVVGLRVADSSVMPSIPGAQLALPTAMIAERAASFILGRK